MKKNIFTILLALGAINLNALVLPEGSDVRIKSIEKNDAGKIVQATFSTPSEINTPIGKILATGTVYFNDKGKVTKVTPKEDGTFTSPKGKINYRGINPINFYDSGCVKSIVIKSVSEIKHNNTVYPAIERISFYDKWIPQSIIPNENVNIELTCGNVSCRSKEMINFYATGEIKNLRLAQDTELTTDKEKFTACSTLNVSKDGKIQSCYISSSNGLETKYGKVYPNSYYYTFFYTDGTVKELVSADVMEIQAGGKKLTTVADTTVHFAKNGVVNRATVSGNKIDFYGWDINIHNSSYTFIVYPNKRILITYTNGPLLNGKNISNQYYNEATLLLDKDNCYSWYKGKHSISLCVYDKNTYEEKEYNFKGTFPTYYNTDKEIDYVHPPLIFDEENKVIGYRKSYVGQGVFIMEWDRYEYHDIDSYGPYEKDVLF